MIHGPHKLVIGVASVVAALIALPLLWTAGVLDYDVWRRDNPLVSPIAVARVHDGAITLADGRALRPAGVTRADSVSTEDYDKALRVLVAQGVVVIRDLGDGSAFLLAEPKFYNWCGTRGADGIPWKRRAGTYFQCPASETLVHTAYARPTLDQAGLTAREIWRLEGVEQFGGSAESPRPISATLVAFRFESSERFLSDYDTMLEALWKPPPP